MKVFNLLFLIFFSLALVSCNDDGGGVIVVEDPAPQDTGTTPTVPVEPPYTGPFGGPVDGDESIPSPSPYEPPYSSSELQSMIDDTPSGGTLYLERDALITGIGLSLTKPITITTSPSLAKPIRFSARILPNLFNVTANNIFLTNMVFDLTNVFSFLSDDIDPITNRPMYSGLNITNCQFLLRGNSSLMIIHNGTTITKSSIIGLDTIRRPDRPMVYLFGNNFSITANNILDVYDNYSLGIYLADVDGVLIQENVIRSFAQKYVGTIGITFSSNITIRGNFLYDANIDKVNLEFGEDEDMTGSIAIALEQSHNISDQGHFNNYNAQIFNMSDEEEGFSTNISLSPGSTLVPFDKDVLFNHLPTEDFSPYCLIGINPGLSVVPKSTWSSYQREDGSTLYYSGAIKPACL